MTDTYVFLIREHDWDSDRFLPGAEEAPDLDATFGEHREFQEAVAALGARIVGGQALQHARHGGVVTPGPEGRQVEDAVWTDSPYADSSELITGFYAVECADDAQARTVAALVPTNGTVEWRKVFPTG
ncbi:Uncharacterized conserved protein [Nocardioides scoriae]|uniref:Uncharacterized conserved protein n=1 Tax=Nocardioides scoriae TaxID=642780 RepID=A0A1H1Q222_9ACTN|nr:YciI family protein [Nocardioides scoriae]SDS17528.1 Uncharacterized conserved protein [Nocardioides scoriae]